MKRPPALQLNVLRRVMQLESTAAQHITTVSSAENGLHYCRHRMRIIMYAHYSYTLDILLKYSLTKDVVDANHGVHSQIIFFCAQAFHGDVV